MANTIANRVYRDKYRKATLEHALKSKMVAMDITQVDRSNNLRIQSPYSSTPTVTVQALAGTYTVADFTTTDDTLTVTDEFVVAEHIYDFQEALTQFDLFADRVERQGYAIALKTDQWVLNNLCEDGTGTYSTPVGGFTTQANINEIFANLNSKFDGYAEAYQGKFVVLEAGDMVGLYQNGIITGFNNADQIIKNGKVSSWLGIDIYVVPDGTYTNATVGTTTWTNSGHRVAGIKGLATTAFPGGFKFEEKRVTGKTGMEVVTYGYIGFKLWYNVTGLIIDITVN